jgi:hypothetical protein
MSNYLNRISFSIEYYDEQNYKELEENFQQYNLAKNVQEYIDYYKNNPDSVRVKYDYLKNRMSGISHYVGECFVESLEKYEIKNTSLLNFIIGNYPDKIEGYSLGDYVNYCGVISRFFDWTAFLKLDDSSKRLAILDLIYESMIIYANKFNLDTISLEKAYQETKEKLKDFIIVKKHLYQKRNQYKLYKTYKYNFETVEYGIIFEDLRTKQKDRIQVCEKQHFYGIEKPWLTIHDLIKMPQHLKYNGFNKEIDTYEMSYGNERYIFDIKTKKLS